MPLPIPRHNVNLIRSELALLLAGLFRRPKVTLAVSAFEHDFAQRIGVSHCFAFTSGSAALYHGILSSDLKQGDSILMPAYEFSSVPRTLRLAGLCPVFADVDPETGNVTVETLKQAYENSVRAVLVANIHGQAADLFAIAKWCAEMDLLLIEDCAHSAGASLGDQMTGSFGHFAIFSFGTGKSLTTCGGGMLATSDHCLATKLNAKTRIMAPPPRREEIMRIMTSLAQTLFSWRPVFSVAVYPLLRLGSLVFSGRPADQGRKKNERDLAAVPRAFQLRMPELSAKLGLSQLQRLDRLNRARQENAGVLIDELSNLERIRIMQVNPIGINVRLNLPITVPDRPRFICHMIKRGIDLRKDYLTRYEDRKPHGISPSDTVYLPNHPALNQDDMKRIASAVKEYAYTLR